MLIGSVTLIGQWAEIMTLYDPHVPCYVILLVIGPGTPKRHPLSHNLTPSNY